MSHASNGSNLQATDLRPAQTIPEIQQNTVLNIEQIRNEDAPQENSEELATGRQMMISKINQRANEQEINDFAGLPPTFQLKTPVYFKPRLIKPHSPTQQNSPKINKEPAQGLNSSQWQQFVKQTYDNYCKSTYHTGKTPTFDLIQSNANKMTASVFVKFCRDFEIKLDLVTLMNIFKKATSFGSSMSFFQFVEALFIITQSLFQKDFVNVNDENEFMDASESQKQKIEKKQANKKREPPQNFDKFLKIINMDSPNAFKRKKISLDIKARIHGVNPHQNLIKLKPTSGYKFQIKALNGKNSQDLKDQLDIRKKEKSASKERQKELKQLKEKIKAYRYADFNKIAVSDKKITKGGYMSPPRGNQELQSIIISGDSKIINGSLLESYIKPLKSSKILERNQTQALKLGLKKRNQRHLTEFNTYNNSLQNSIYQDSLEKKTYRGEPSLGSEDSMLSKLNKKTKGYLSKFREKDRKAVNDSINKQKSSYQINSIIKQARNDVNDHNTHTTKRKTVISHNPNGHETQKRISIKFKTTPDEKEVYSLGLQDFIGNLNQNDEYLQNLSLVKKAENQSRKHIAQELIKF